jgi:hypothetical protein
MQRVVTDDLDHNAVHDDDSRHVDNDVDDRGHDVDDRGHDVDYRARLVETEVEAFDHDDDVGTWRQYVDDSTAIGRCTHHRWRATPSFG